MSVAWVIVTGLMARSRLESARDEIPRLQSAIVAGRLDEAHALASRIATQTGSAHQLTSGPAWWVIANLPVAGTPFRTGRVVAYQADRIGGGALPSMLRLADEVVRAPHTSSSIDLRPLGGATTALMSASRTVDGATAAIAASEPSWLPLVSNARASTVGNLRQLGGELRTAHRAVATALPMLGQRRPQRYFLGFMNEAESRALGGIPGAFAIVTADRGRITFTHFGTDDDLFHVRADVRLDPEYRALYRQDNPTGIFQNSDVSPNFPDAARIWAGMWQRKSGEHVDGAIAIDPSAIGYLLAATGPATLPGGGSVSADNVVSLAQEKQYQLYGGTSATDTAARKRFLVSIAAAVAARITHAQSVSALIPAAQRAIHERRLLVWSADQTREANLAHFGLAGVLDPGERPFSAFFVNNGAGGKMDFYSESAMHYRRTSCAAGATATAILTLTNDAPPYALPPYVTIVLGPKPPGTRPGFNRLVVAYYATPGAVVRSVTLDGKRQILASTAEDGLTTVRLIVDIPRNATRTLRVTTTEPAAHGPVQIVRQPGVRPITVTTDAPACR